MEKDIIIEALHRFRDIVDHARPQTHDAYRPVEADRRLVRLAIKKYNKAAQWRSGLSRLPTDEKELLT